jgi:hypothetical protein
MLKNVYAYNLFPPHTLSPGNARALAEENDSAFNASSSSLPPVSPNKRSSFAPGNTTKVLADLQAGVLNAKNALENTKGQLRLSQRQVSVLTRQAEDLKESRERLRLENEGLNNVVGRKERLLQEVSSSPRLGCFSLSLAGARPTFRCWSARGGRRRKWYRSSLL